MGAKWRNIYKEMDYLVIIGGKDGRYKVVGGGRGGVSEKKLY